MSITLPPRQPARTDVEMFGPYRLEGLLGRGSTGEVFRAYDTVRERPVALKRLCPELSDDDGYAEEFRRATRVTARLPSPHVIPIHDFGTIDGALFIDMQLVAGVDLAREIAEHGPLGAVRAAAVVRRIADALDDAHADGLVHGEVTPSNVLLSQHRGRDVVHLVDFGVARPGSRRTDDVHALGCLLVAALTGHPAFPDDDPWATAGRRYAELPRITDRRRGLPVAVNAVVARALAPSPADRYATAGELADAAHLALAGSTTPTAARLDTSRGRTGPFTAPPTTGGTTGGAPAVRYVPAPTGTAGSGWPTTSVPSPRRAPSPRTGPSPLPVREPWTGPAAIAAPASAPLPGARRRRRRPSWVVLLSVLAVVALLAAIAVVAGGAPTPTPDPRPAAAGAPAPATGRLAAAFPDIAAPGSTCSPYPAGPEQYLTSAGARPVAVIRCDYGAAVPGGYVYYTEWPTVADARRWQADQASRGPNLGGTTQWVDGAGTAQGPIHTHTSPDGPVYATAAYAERPYSFDIVTRSPEEADRMFPAMRLLPAAQVPG